MTSAAPCEGASKVFADSDRDISPENPDLAKLIKPGARHGGRSRPRADRIIRG